MDEDEDLIEGRIHWNGSCRSVSRFINIGLDDMSGFGDADAESGFDFLTQGRPILFEESVDSALLRKWCYDIDAAEQPVIQFRIGKVRARRTPKT